LTGASKAIPQAISIRYRRDVSVLEEQLVLGEAPPPKRRTTRRRTEATLLVMAAAIVTGAYIILSLAQTKKIPANLIPFLVIVLLLAMVGHLVNRKLAPDANPIILPMVLLLNGLGYVMIARLDPHEARLQAGWSAVAMGFYFLTLLWIKRSAVLDRYRYLLMLGGIALLMLPLLPHLGTNINGTRLWIRLGPLSFQPVELAKIALAAFFASYFVEKRDLLRTPTKRVGRVMVPDPRVALPIVLAWAFAVLIITAERDIGFALLIFVLFIVMLWSATGRVAYLGLGVVLFVAATFLGMHLFHHVDERITVWLDPWKHPKTSGYQLIQAQYAFGSGGLTGAGLGFGHPSLVPIASSDFIFAAFGEEFGLLGTSALLFAFLLLVGTGLRIALEARTDFGKLLAIGLTTLLGFQSFFIMAGVTRLLPVTGITLPFVAYGGSALVANYILAALLMRVSDETEEFHRLRA
jgi:peptidoglycan glycosyltransferase